MGRAARRPPPLLPVSASHRKPPPSPASGCASLGKMVATLASPLLGLVPSERPPPLLPISACHCKPPPSSAAGCASPWKMMVLASSLMRLVPSEHPPPLLPVSACHCKPPPCSASGCASPGKMVATLASSLLGLLPSELEVEKAIRALLDLWQSASSSGSEQNWMRLFGCRDMSILISSGWGRVRHALHLLQTEPAIKTLVISLVLDKAFWSAIMNNQAVQKFQELLLSDGTRSPQIWEQVDWGTNNPQWILDILKDKIMQLVEKFKLSTAELDDGDGSSLLLSVLIILVGVVARVPFAR